MQTSSPTGADFLCLVEAGPLLLGHLHIGCGAFPLGGGPRYHVQGGDRPGLLWKFLVSTVIEILQVVDLTNSTVDPREEGEVEILRRTPLWHNLVYKNMVRHLLPVLTSQVGNRRLEK